MIVGCERCSTQFQLDDSRVPPGGVKVRCSRCKHAFEVFPEGAAPAADEDAIHAIAERAAGSDGIPDATEDPPEAPPAAAADAPRTGDEAAADPTLEDDEPSWEFGDGFGDLGGDPEDSVDGLSGSGEGPGLGPDSEAGSGLELAGGNPRGEGADPTPGDGARRGDDSGDAMASALFESEALADAATPELATEPASRTEPGSAGRVAGDDLGSPMDWDLFDAPAAGAGSASAAAEAGVFSIERAAARPQSPFSADSAGEDLESDARQIWARRAGTAAGWLATAGLCLAGLAGGLRPAPAVPLAPAAPGEGWAFEEVEGRWVDHLSRGPVFAVSGRVRNTAGSSRALPALEVVWRDRSGAAVGRPTPLAVPRSEAALREAPLDEGTRSPLTGTALRPGAGLRFLALAADLPYAADHFEVRLRRAVEATDPGAD